MISIVIPVYNERDSVTTLHAELLAVLRDVGKPFEIIYVDDGSDDGTLAEIKKLASVRVISFARNFGKSQALQAGFAEARGELIFTMDGDLQDDPREMPSFLKKMDETGADLVIGWKQGRRDGLAKKAVSAIANGVARLLAGTSVHDMNCGFKLYIGEAARSLDLYGDMHRYIPALLKMHGFRIAEVPIAHRERRFGASKYGNFRRLPKSFFDFVTLLLMRRFMDRPMHFFGIIGITSSLAGAAILAYLTYLKFGFGEAIGNRPLLLLGILLFVIGIQLFSSGFLGELLIRQNTKRGAYTVRERVERP